MSEYILEANHITKEFPGVKALNDVTLKLKSGEVMALLGENGAGKSTLSKIISGVYSCDEGELILFGNKVSNLNPKSAQELGVAIIHQELKMCGHLTIAENMFLGREPLKNGLVDSKKMHEESAKVLAELKINLNPKMTVGDLTIANQQLVEIARAISTNAKILIMDEPTSSLTESEILEVFNIVKDLRDKGCGIIYISHRLEELQYITDRVTILRDGNFVTCQNFSDMTMSDIIAAMVGREITEKYPRVQCSKGKKIFEVKNLCAGQLVQDVSFELYEGEILGFAGLIGAGRTETAKALFGINPIESGQIFLDGKEVKIRRAEDAIKSGIVYVPEDRKNEGLCVKRSVRENIGLSNMDWLGGKTGVVRTKKETEITQKAITELNIKLPNMEANAGNLSGGNQQKIVIAKWLARNSRIIIFDEPTRGIDVAAKVEIYNLINQLKQSGIGVIIISSEMPEVIGMSDRIAVMCEGQIRAMLSCEEVTQELIMRHAADYQSAYGKQASVS